MKFFNFIFFLLIYSCSLQTNENSDIIARVGENYLYKLDLQDQIGPLYSEDSLQIAKSLINDWAEELLYLEKAEINLSFSEIKKIDELVNSYRNDLYVQTYKDKAIQTQLDSNVQLKK